MASGGQVGALGLIALIAGGTGAVVAVRWLQPSAAAAPERLADDLGGSSVELDALRRRVAALEERGGDLPPLPGSDGPGATGGSAPAPAGPEQSAGAARDAAAGDSATVPTPSGASGEGVGVDASGKQHTVTPLQRLEQTIKTLRQRLKRIEDAGDEVDTTKLTPDELGQRAAEAWEAQQWKKGARLYRALLAKAPDHPQAADARWEIGSQAADNDEGIQLLEQFIAKDTEHSWHPYARYYLGRRYHTAENPTRAAQEFEQALQTSGANPYFGIMNRWELAQLADARGDQASGDQFCRDALAKHGTCAWGSVLSTLAAMRKRLGIPEPAPTPKKQ